MSLPANILLLWGSGNVPAGFAEHTAGYGRYLRFGTAASQSGQSTHEHAAPYSHSLADHDNTTHFHSLSYSDTSSVTAGDSSPSIEALVPHGSGHNAYSSTSTNHSARDDTSVFVAQNTPYYYAFRVIRNVSATKIPADAYVFGFDAIEGCIGEHGLYSRFLKLDATPGSGGDETLWHTLPGQNHGGLLQHDHPWGESGYSGERVYVDGGWWSDTYSEGPHVHSYSGHSSVQAPIGDADGISDPGTYWRDLLDRVPIRLLRVAAAMLAKDKLCALWDSQYGSIPEGWTAVDPEGSYGGYAWSDPNATAPTLVPASASCPTTLSHFHTVGAHDHSAQEAYHIPGSKADSGNVPIASGGHTVTWQEASAYNVGSYYDSNLTTGDVTPPTQTYILIRKVGDDTEPGGNEYNETCSGGIAVGGNASAAARFATDAGGEVSVRGAGTPVATYQALAQGAVSLAGEAAIAGAYVIDNAGSIELAGQATVGAVYPVEAACRMQISGGATAGIVFSAEATGGPMMGGRSSVQAVLSEQATGAMLLGGHGLERCLPKARVLLGRLTVRPYLQASVFATAAMAGVICGTAVLAGCCWVATCLTARAMCAPAWRATIRVTHSH